MLSLVRFAQTDNSDLIGPEPYTTGPNQEQVAGAAAGLGIVMLIFFILSLVNFVFFVLALIHLIKNPDVPNRVLWIVLSILIPLAPIVYYFGPRRSYDNSKGSSAAPITGSQSHQTNNSAPGQTGQAGQPTQFGAATGTASTPSVEQASTSEYVNNTTPAATPETVSPSAPQVAAAPENPVQLPQNPNTFEPSQDPSPSNQPFQPAEPQATPSDQNNIEVVSAPSEEENPNQTSPPNQNNQV